MQWNNTSQYDRQGIQHNIAQSTECTELFTITGSLLLKSVLRPEDRIMRNMTVYWRDFQDWQNYSRTCVPIILTIPPEWKYSGEDFKNKMRISTVKTHKPNILLNVPQSWSNDETLGLHYEGIQQLDNN